MEALIDLSNPLLTPKESLVLNMLIKKRMDYLHQGRGREAHGVAISMVIVWRGLIRPDMVLDIELPDTQAGAIDPLTGKAEP